MDLSFRIMNKVVKSNIIKSEMKLKKVFFNISSLNVMRHFFKMALQNYGHFESRKVNPSCLKSVSWLLNTYIIHLLITQQANRR